MRIITKYFLVAQIMLLAIGCDKSVQPAPEVSKLSTINSEKLNFTSDSLYNNLNLKYSISELDNIHGLSNNSVNTIFQDSENLIWVGTWDGLNRYDGYTFKTFNQEINNDKSLSNQVILKIDEDSKGYIWVLTLNGINRYDKKTDQFQRYYFSIKNHHPFSESEFNMALDASKNVFCAVKDWGIGYFDGTSFKKCDGNYTSTKVVKKMEFTPTGQLLVLYNNDELFCLTFDTKNGETKTIAKVELIANNIKTFKVATHTKVATVSNKGIASFYSLTDKKAQKLSVEKVENIIGNIPEGTILSSKSGYSIADNSGNIIRNSRLHYLKDQKITILIQGTENVLLAGTDGDGVFIMQPLKKLFNLITKTQVPELEGGIVRTFLNVPGKYFCVGTKGKGLFVFPNNDLLKTENFLNFKNYNENNSNLNNNIYALSQGKEDLVFIGTDGEGLTIYDTKNSKLIHWRDIIGSDQCDYFKSIYSIYQDDDGTIWLGTNGYGMIRLKIERTGNQIKLTNFKKYIATKSDKTLSSNTIFSIIPKNKNQLWIGTRFGGLNLFEKETSQFTTYKNIPNDPQSLSNNDILCLNLDANNRLWIGTSFGLTVLNEQKKGERAVFKSYTVKEGLPNNTIHGIVADKKSNLWISTNFGLSNFIIKESKFINYTKSDGLQNNEFSDGAFYQDPNSENIFMGGIKGFNYFLPKKVKESTEIPNLLINKISGQNQDIPYYQGLVITPNSKTFPTINLKYDQNFFDIELAALTNINNEKCQYAYQLKNFDKNWNTINNRRNISFTNVPKGNYSLWIKWSNSDGVWSEPIHAIDIQIAAVYWQSNLAKIIYLCLFLILLKFVYNYYKKRQILNQNILFQTREKEIHENRIAFFTNVAHEFQTPLTLIVGPVQKLSEKTKLGEKNQKLVKMIQRNSSRLLFLTQQLLEFRKAEFDHLEVEVKEFDLANLIQQIAELFDDWALDKNIKFTLDIPSELRGWYDKDKIEKIVFNLMSNAFKYSPENGEINMKLFFQDQQPEKLNITITNTGRGIPEKDLKSLFDMYFLSDNIKSTDNGVFRTGIGLAYVKKMVTALRGEVLVSSLTNEITTFTVLLPCNKSFFTEKEVNLAVNPILLSPYLKNILEEIPEKPLEAPKKISTLDLLEDQRKVVLIVEDEKEIHQYLNDLLGKKYKIIQAYNGLEALEVIKSKLPDIIISDVMMPEMDGIELCKSIKGHVRTCHIPFIMLTAKSSIQNRIEGLESGANSYIPKPFHPDHLFIRIEKLLGEKEFLQKHLAQDDFTEKLSNHSFENDEKEFIRKVIDLINNNIENENLQSLFIEKEMGMSNSQLYRKIKQIFGFSPGDLIRTIRIKHAAKLLRKNNLTVSEVCYKSGFNNRSYFYREFKKVYQLTPKNYYNKLNSDKKTNISDSDNQYNTE